MKVEQFFKEDERERTELYTNSFQTSTQQCAAVVRVLTEGDVRNMMQRQTIGRLLLMLQAKGECIQLLPFAIHILLTYTGYLIL